MSSRKTDQKGQGRPSTSSKRALTSLKGRKFYATFQYPDGPYRACVAIEKGDDPAALGYQVGVIPGGRYAAASWRTGPSARGKSQTCLKN